MFKPEESGGEAKVQRFRGRDHSKRSSLIEGHCAMLHPRRP